MTLGIAAGIALAFAIIAGWMDWRRNNRDQLDKVGWVNWTLLMVLAGIAAAMLGLLAVGGL
ncbi:hypothetical protein HFP51_06590 [Parasphingopyxis sp. CP4]|uniref:hypothetical protein n=1 Tax=Parasphingopyxis sp. CP4 TaxID=2724527 RepID=UPI0015A1D9CC|nr:hypothetical protein [Parasphingopyxis sp. CP4]QLC21877.1 hypothetical protein HFP51_06590 [Parasphingopyxis sp. CP4]